MGIAALALGAAIAAAVHAYFRQLDTIGQQVTSANLALSGRLAETFGAVRTTRIVHAEESEAPRFATLNVAQAEAEERPHQGYGGLQPLIELLGVIVAMMLMASPNSLQVGTASMSTVNHT